MTQPTAEVGAQIDFKRRQSLHANKIFACQGCGAPGVYRHGNNDAEVAHYKQWPGIYVEAADLKEGTPVGDICPNCKTKRPEDVSLGVIWSRDA